MTLFVLSNICKSGTACERCRDRQRGAGLRAQWEKLYTPPDGWECPKERGAKPWGWKAPSRGLGDTLAKVIQTVTLGKVKPCEPCKKRQAVLNKLVPYSKGE